jgi:acyl phosphate:glycerol-3-phosphate acyltransferase
MNAWTVGLMLIGYLIGSIPFSFLVARARGVDLRKVGSGNTGASNVWRNLGFRWFLIALALDIFKGWLPVYLARVVAELPPVGVVLVGLATILGHVYPIFLGFRGGKAVATSGGVILGIAPILTLIAAAIWTVVMKLSGYPSVSSLVSAALTAVLAIGMLLTDRLNALYAILIVISVIYVFYLHRSNIGRLMRGQEIGIGPRQ